MARKFRGQDEVRVDAKGRLSIPPKFRRVFEAADPDFTARGRASMVIVFGPERWNWIELYGMDAVAEIDAQIDQLPRYSDERRRLTDIMHGTAEEIEIDGDGRIVLPARLRERIGVSDQAFIISCGDYLQLWDPGTWAAEGAGRSAHEEGGLDPRIALAPPPPVQPEAREP